VDRPAVPILARLPLLLPAAGWLTGLLFARTDAVPIPVALGLAAAGLMLGLRRSLRPFALALAAGQVSGVVRAADGRVYVIKGDTHKEKEAKVEVEEKPNGRITETRILTDRFVPVIRALDFTPGSPSFGQVLVIR